ncbi:RDD family protein [Flavobacterium sp. GSP27]|uniref:RDD family protein n=1 Tax=unclassified Flavobacterium TaxID=196869 RepID=UPI000F84C138|nr:MULTISPECIES: RDD family protein [unclassified Flavobacterium]RTY76133.1 RDD family protein [Flavobacterium sp. LS1R10]RTY94426.1 RDD family protein [Flavobacterium sp. GSN2]RTZ10174.1 RDD family protein [Flavobacterium sp. GSP27]
MENKKFTITDDLLASKSQRLLNFSIDLFIIYVIEISIGTTIILIGDLTNSDTASNWVTSLRIVESFFFGLVILFFYYGLSEMYFSRTFGKYFTKTVVIKHDGSKPNMKSIIVRTVSRLIPLEPFSFLTAERGWHDTLSVTYVVKKHEFIAKKKLFTEE